MLKRGDLLDDRYRILTMIGQGGQSRVWLALNERANKKWAIKELREDLDDRLLAHRNLENEVSILKGLRHPCLPAVADVIYTADGCMYVVMDYIEGSSLIGILREKGAQPEDTAIKWCLMLCDVLSYLHRQDPPVIFRDLKPGNIILKPDGRITLIDFGSARLNRHGIDPDTGEHYPQDDDTVCLGTRGYAAPEQFGGHGHTDARTDIYCLGATLFHILTGRTPQTTPFAPLSLRSADPSLSKALDKIVRKCTMPDPDRRYSSCSELKRALAHYKDRDRELVLLPAAVLCAAAVFSIYLFSGTINAHAGAAGGDDKAAEAAPAQSGVNVPAGDGLLDEEQAIKLLRTDLGTVNVIIASVREGSIDDETARKYRAALSEITSRMDMFIISSSDDDGDIPDILRSEEIRGLSLELVSALRDAEALLDGR